MSIKDNIKEKINEIEIHHEEHAEHKLEKYFEKDVRDADKVDEKYEKTKERLYDEDNKTKYVH